MNKIALFFLFIITCTLSANEQNNGTSNQHIQNSQTADQKNGTFEVNLAIEALNVEGVEKFVAQKKLFDKQAALAVVNEQLEKHSYKLLNRHNALCGTAFLVGIGCTAYCYQTIKKHKKQLPAFNLSTCLQLLWKPIANAAILFAGGSSARIKGNNDIEEAFNGLGLSLSVSLVASIGFAKPYISARIATNKLRKIKTVLEHYSPEKKEPEKSIAQNG